MVRRRIEVATGAQLGAALRDVLKNTVAFLDCPMTDEQMLAVWFDGYPQPVLDAIEILQDAHFLAVHEGAHDATPTFAVRELGVGVRFKLRSGQRLFRIVPQYGRHRLPLVKCGHVNLRNVLWSTFEKVLDSSERKAVIDWVNATAECTVKHKEVKQTIEEVCKMLSTAGQLKRMVPDLVGYLPPSLQEAVMEQKRASPFPDAWASYDKARVDRMLTALAEGHLCKGVNQREVTGVYSWAEYLPR
jgi:hypothetical protein